MERHREITKASWLQQKVRRKVGPIRKQKCFYQEAKWVILCVHDERIPQLEWYPSDKAAIYHRPLKVLDLLECSFVTSVIDDDRCFFIGFKNPDRPQIELAALSETERQEWIEILSCTLTRLDCLDTNTNLYSPLPLSPVRASQPNPLDFDPPSPQSTPPRLSLPVPFQSPSNIRSNPHNLDAIVPVIDSDSPSNAHAPNPPLSSPENEQSDFYERIIRGVNLLGESTLSDSVFVESEFISTSPESGNISGQRHTSVSSNSTMVQHEKAPALPPREVDNTSIINSQLFGYFENRCCSLESIYDSPRPSMLMHDSLTAIPEASSSRDSSATTMTTDSSSMSQETTSRPSSHTDLDLVIHSIQTPTCNRSVLYENSPSSKQSTDDPIINHYSSPLNSPTFIHSQLSFRPSNSSLIYSEPIYSEALGNISTREREYDKIRLQMTKSKLKIAVSLADGTDGLILVEVSSKFWIAGWTENSRKRLESSFHIGDQVLSINEKTLISMAQLPALYYETVPGLPIEFGIRRLPNALIYSMTRRSGESLGLVLGKGTNKISEIQAESLADKAKMVKSVPSFFDNAKSITMNAVLTEINGHSLNLFAKNFKTSQKLAMLSDDIILIVQPYDFIKALKQQLKKRKNYRQFLID